MATNQQQLAASGYAPQQMLPEEQQPAFPSSGQTPPMMQTTAAPAPNQTMQTTAAPAAPAPPVGGAAFDPSNIPTLNPGTSMASASFSAVDPMSNLRGVQINPATDPRLAATQQGVDAVAQNVQAGVGDLNSRVTEIANRVGTLSPGSPEAAGARSQASATLQGLEGPDRAQIADDIFGRLVESSRPAYEQELRGVGQKAAAFGRLGSGMTTSDLGDVQQRREEGLTRARGQLASEAAGLSLQDRVQKLASELSAGASFQNADLAQAGFGLDQAGTQANLYGTGFDASRAGLSDLAGLEGMQYGQGAGQRNELRGERDFQNLLARLSVDDRVRQTLTEDQLLNSAVDRENSRLNLMGSSGFGGLPTGTLQNAALNQAGQAGASGQTAADIIAALAAAGRI